jgi:hypothetical protein
MAIRWATPVARKTSQSAWSIAFWSPVTNAAITPADRGSATRSKTASRTVSRKRSTGWRQVTAMRSGRGSRAPVRTWPVGVHALLPKAQFLVEAMGVEIAVGRPESHRHAPAFAGVHGAGRVDCTAGSAP